MLAVLRPVWVLFLLTLLQACGGGGDRQEPPRIELQPQSISVEIGEPARFSVQASGPELRYQWQRDGQDIAGAQGPQYELAAAEAGQQGQRFSVRVSNGAGSVTSQAAVLAVTPPPIRILQSPQLPPTPYAGLRLSLTVQASTRLGDIGYQWLRNGQPLPGATAATLELTLQPADAGAQFAVQLRSSLGAQAETPALSVQLQTPRIERSEIDQLPPATLARLIAAEQAVLLAAPWAVDNPALMARLLLDEWKRVAPLRAPLSGSDTVRRVTREEWEVLFDLLLEGRWGTPGALARTVDPSFEASDGYFGRCAPDMEGNDTERDALRHAYWNALMTAATSQSVAERFATAHELGPARLAGIDIATDARARMDLHNNAVGRTVAAAHPSATPAQLLELLLALPTVRFEANGRFPIAPGSLVYFAGTQAQPWSGRYTGTLTNPDSGGPWQAEIQMAQCGSQLRGTALYVRGSERSQRRLSGSLTTPHLMSLSLSAPFAWESNNTACLNVTLLLNAQGSRLNGAWGASNCPRGGQLDVLRTP